MNRTKIVVATHNLGKLKNFKALFKNTAIEILPLSDFDVPQAEETGLTYIENAILKARNACLHTGLPAIADDSGLAVDILKGKPGIHSARYFGEGATDQKNINKLLERLIDIQSLTDRTAAFHCVLVFMKHAEDPAPIIAHGVWKGQIQFQPSGEYGFGYDPIFFVPELNCTAAQLPPEEKNQYSHRGKATQELLEKLKGAVCL